MSGKGQIISCVFIVAILAGVLGWRVLDRESDQGSSVESGTPQESALEVEPVDEGVSASAGVPAVDEGIAFRDEPESTAEAAALLSQRIDLSDPEKREELVAKLKKIDEDHATEVERKAKALGIPVRGVRDDGTEFVLWGFEGDRPIYEQTENVKAAISTAAHQVRSTSPFNVIGTGETIGMWEVGQPRSSHNEFGNPSRLTFGQGGSGTSDHATHVAGTLIAAGVNSALLGMAPGAKIRSYSSGFDSTEMTSIGAAVAGEPGKIYLSNHSYGFGAGWEGTEWEGVFVDDANAANDFEEDFGRYSSLSALMDGVTYNLPYYLPFFSAGNQRNDNAPSNGQSFTHNSSTYTYDSSRHPLGDGVYKNGYDTCEGKKVGKNVMTVGAVNDAASGSSRNLTLATLADFSSTGPMDDGRIKPDIVANGASLMSAGASSDSASTSFSGTSMSSPNAAGSAALLVDYYGSRFPGGAMRAATLKGLILHTADDLGNAGPDYLFGWGLMNTRAAADLIKDHADNGGGRIVEETIQSSDSVKEWYGFANGGQPLRVTLCWTDPAGSDKSGHENRSRALVNDLNITVQGPGGTHLPYVMPHVGDWSIGTLDDVATTGVNNVDNVEQVYLSTAATGSYTVSVNYTGALTNGLQDYSLIITGLEKTFQIVGDDFVASGSGGGPFAPSFVDYTLVNDSLSPFSWTASDDMGWLDLNVTSGSIPGGGNFVVRAELNGAAASLPGGVYEGEITVTDVASGSNQKIPVRLEILAQAELPFWEDFEGALPDYWSITGTGAARTIVTSANGPYAGTGHLTMDSSTGSTYSRNELTLAIDLSGAENLELSFWAKEFGDESDSPPASPFIGGADFDGVAVSVDGSSWYSIMTFPFSFNSYQEFVIDLDAAIATHGLSYSSEFFIRFNHYDNSSITLDGIAIDDIRISEVGEPEIEVEDGDGSGLLSGVALISADSVPIGSSGIPEILTIFNNGTGTLSGLAVTKSGSHSGDFGLGSLGASSLEPGQSTDFSVTFSPSAVGMRTASIQVASNDADEGSFEIQFMGVGLHTHESWRQEYFQTTANAGDAADQVDPNHDGINNLMAFATGLNPLVSGVVPFELEIDGSNLAVSYQRSRSAMAAGVVFDVEWSETLESDWVTVGVVEDDVSDNGVLQQVEVSLPKGTDKRFVRLKVTKP